MPVVILAGGRGTRMREETEYRPKPLVKIGHQPILWHIMKLYAHYGFQNFIICLGYKGEMIREFFYHYRVNTGDVLVDVRSQELTPLRRGFDDVDWKVILAETGDDTMTGGRLRRIRDYIGSENFLMTYGDAVADVDIGALVKHHRGAGCIASVTGIQPVSRFGEMTLEGERVRRFHEKSGQDTWINGGFFVFSRKIFDYLDGDTCVLEQAPLQKLAEDHQLSVYRHSGYWQCMDTYRESEILNNLWSLGNAPWKVWKS